MRLLLALSLAVNGACVVATDHVRTSVVEICTTPVPLAFEKESEALYIAMLAVEGLAKELDIDAFAGLASIELEALAGVEDLGFVTTISADLSAQGSSLPAVRVAEEATITDDEVLIVHGRSEVNLIDYLETERLELHIEAHGASMSDMFVATAAACLDVDGVQIED